MIALGLIIMGLVVGGLVTLICVMLEIDNEEK